jgi:DNA-binding MarR family transcriptional regulator
MGGQDETVTDRATVAADDELVEEAIALLPEIGKSLYLAIARHAREAGLSPPQIKALGYLFHRGSCAVRDVADGLGISMATASETLDRLVELGLLERATDPVDRRRAIVALTPEAQRLLTEVTAVRRRQVRAALERLAPSERHVFPRALQALVEALREGCEPTTCPADAVGPRQPNDRGAALPVDAGVRRR